MTVVSVQEQCEWESRRLWHGVSKGIREGDFDIAAKEKSRIEVGFRHFYSEVVVIVCCLRMSKGKDDGMKLPLELHGLSNISSTSTMTLHVSLLTLFNCSSHHSSPDEHLAKLFHGHPASEDAYDYLNNGPSA